MPKLDGFFAITLDAPTFLIPFFIDRPGSNRSLVQQISENDRVQSFIEIEIDGNCDPPITRPDVSIGQFALWAFRSSSGELLQGKRTDLLFALKAKLAVDEFREFPLIENQVAKFCDARDIYEDSLPPSFNAIADMSLVMGEIWRDSVILLPVAKKEISTALTSDLLKTNLDHIRIVGLKKKVRIELPATLYDHFDLPPKRWTGLSCF
jgi:hypothetical protein